MLFYVSNLENRGLNFAGAIDTRVPSRCKRVCTNQGSVCGSTPVFAMKLGYSETVLLQFKRDL